jgi:signal transduction histidine kinase
VAGAAEAEGLSVRLNEVIAGLDDTIVEIRSAIFELGLVGTARGARAQITELLREMTELLGFEVRIAFDGPVDNGIPDAVLEQLIATLQEALTNVARHADATEVSAMLSVHGSLCRLQVSDNGRGMSGGDRSAGGHGLNNMHRRAERLHGRLEVSNNATGGTTVDWQVLTK